MRKAGLCALRSRPPVRRSHDVSRPSGAFGRMLGQASRSTAHARPTCNRAPSLRRENREIPWENSGGTWRGHVACPWSGRIGRFVLEAYEDRVARAYFAAAKSCESTFYEVAPYRPNARGAAEFRWRPPDATPAREIHLPAKKSAKDKYTIPGGTHITKPASC